MDYQVAWEDLKKYLEKRIVEMEKNVKLLEPECIYTNVEIAQLQSLLAHMMWYEKRS